MRRRMIVLILQAAAALAGLAALWFLSPPAAVGADALLEYRVAQLERAVAILTDEHWWLAKLLITNLLAALGSVLVFLLMHWKKR